MAYGIFFCEGKDQRGCGMIKEYGILFQSMAIAIEEMRNGRRQIDAVTFTENQSSQMIEKLLREEIQRW
ncbi:hypothetical protein [Solibaculum mannosilyticum]|uniref:hypothetical protein n=1 Tax=Solibaculum mannosilyticum TaxID=2780922 RepID=UPI0036F420BA